MELANTLALYGATLSPDGFIVTPKGVKTHVRPIIYGRRLRIRSGSGELLYAGPAEPASLCAFIENFWFWSKTWN